MSLYLTRTRNLPVRRMSLLEDPFFGSPVHRELDRVFDSLWAQTFRPPTRRRPEGLPLAVEEDETALTVKIGIGGFEPGDVSVQLHEDVLHVSGDTRRTETPDVDDASTETAEASGEDETDGTVVPVERPRVHRAFEKAWRLDAERYDLEHIQARIVDGALTLTVPRVQDPGPRTIEVQVG